MIGRVASCFALAVGTMLCREHALFNELDMAHYIDADKLRADIERRIAIVSRFNSDFSLGNISAYRIALSFIDTLEEPEIHLPEDTVLFQKGVAEGRRLSEEERGFIRDEVFRDGMKYAFRVIKEILFGVEKLSEDEK